MTDLNVRLWPTPAPASRKLVTIKKSRTVKIYCKYDEPAVDGNKRWYQLRDGIWVPARWVKNINQRTPQPCYGS